jgi:nucleoprotein TPR
MAAEVMDAEAMDTGFIAASYSIPEPTLQALLDAPTVELVKSLLRQVEEKARDTEQLQAEKLRSDVELQSAVRSGNARAKQLKASVDKGLKEVEELRTKLANEGNMK